jgi:hypothetical protein
LNVSWLCSSDENEHEAFGSQDDYHKPVDLSIVKPNGKSNRPWAPKPSNLRSIGI